MKEMSWCFKNGVKIYPVPVEHSEGVRRPRCYIYIESNGKTKKLEGDYAQDKKLVDVLMNTYKQIYNKNQ
jgi:hypothetical protein